MQKFPVALGQIKVWQRLALIGAAFGIPIVTLLYFMVTTVNSYIAFANLEKKGNAYQRPLESLFEDVITAKLQTGTSAGEIASKQVTEDLHDLAAVDKTLGSTLSVPSDQVQKLQASWQEIGDQAEFADYDPLIADIRALITHIGDTSKLILDPDLDSYYVMDITLLGLPSLQDRLQTVVSHSMRLVEQPSISATDRARLAAEVTLLANELDRVKLSTETAVKYDPDFYGVSPSLEPTVTPLVEKTVEQVKEVLALATTIVEDTGRPSRADLLSSGRSSLEGVFSFWAASDVELDKLLDFRIDYYSAQRTNYTVFSLLTVALASLLAWLISRNITRMLGRIRTAAYDISQSLAVLAEQTKSSSIQNAAFSKQMAVGAAEQSRQAEEVSRAVGQISAATQQISASAQDTASTAVRTSQIAQEAGEASEKINKAVDAITAVSEHTSLLALNAAIEAARAGEAGRGFAVVAEEVRKLAEGSGKSAVEIKSVVETINVSTKNAVTASQHVTAQIQELSAGTQQQSAAVTQIAKNMDAIASVAEQNATGIEQLAASVTQQSLISQKVVDAAAQLSALAESLQVLAGNNGRGYLREKMLVGDSGVKPASPSKAPAIFSPTPTPSLALPVASGLTLEQSLGTQPSKTEPKPVVADASAQQSTPIKIDVLAAGPAQNRKPAKII